MATKLFSPSLELRSEPPNSMAKILKVGESTALVSFRGKTFTARMIGENFEAGQDAYFIEHPRGVYWISTQQGSWYSNSLENWLKNKRPAQVALEYFLRKCKKWSPFFLGSDGSLFRKDLGPIIGFDGYGTDAGFDAIDANGDGKISKAEFTDAGGNGDTFDYLDRDGDGFIDRDEWRRGGFRKGGSNSFNQAGTSGGGGGGGGGEEPPPPDDGYKIGDYNIKDADRDNMPPWFTFDSGADPYITWGDQQPSTPFTVIDDFTPPYFNFSFYYNLVASGGYLPSNPNLFGVQRISNAWPKSGGKLRLRDYVPIHSAGQGCAVVFRDGGHFANWAYETYCYFEELPVKIFGVKWT